MPKIYLRAGHGGTSPGTAGNGLVEKQETLKHVLALAAMLSEYEVELKLARTGDTTVSLSAGISEANRWGADLYYSSHINGFSDSRAYGYESFIYTSPSAGSIRAQNILHPRQAAVWVRWGSRDRGMKRANFAELRETAMPAILVEQGFLTNPGDAGLLKQESFLNELTAATVQGFIELYGLKRKGEAVKDPAKYIAVAGDTLQKVAERYNLTVAELKLLNPHLADSMLLEGDIVYLTMPGELEKEFAVLNRELLLCRKKLQEFRELGRQIQSLSQKLA
ncbi:MAG: LysM peptidoglycan-binding domain-containing protein [Firmicutes bacterium]|jgi:N-acetylmuramoyl-L-alanine amidase|nr:LysM peptidoglycan-binding domain-containing protein [Bacillota bacterium]